MSVWQMTLFSFLYRSFTNVKSRSHGAVSCFKNITKQKMRKKSLLKWNKRIVMKWFLSKSWKHSILENALLSPIFQNISCPFLFSISNRADKIILIFTILTDACHLQVWLRKLSRQVAITFYRRFDFHRIFWK